ncbi:hypothetical protein [Pelagibacterium sp.]|uniref:hypothetical protein n=1 Tax=Pelagibacterium sp. TaxID=1967288 RepID=UPI003A932A40
MNLAYFLRERTRIIRLFYDLGQLPFEQRKQDIEKGEGQWEPPPFDPDYDSPEPAYLEEWIDTEHARELVGMLSISLLSDSLKIYFNELEQEIGIEFPRDKDRKTHFKQGFVEGYRQIIEHVMGDAYQTCTVRFDLIEQVVLARNDIAHNDDIHSFHGSHNTRTLEKHPNPFFISDDANYDPNNTLPWRRLKIEISRERLMEAIEEVEKLADWVQENDARIWQWRRGVPKDS